MEVLNNNFKHFNEYGCTKNCLPWYLITNYDHNDTIQCQSDKEMECALNVINNEYLKILHQLVPNYTKKFQSRLRTVTD